MVRGRPIPHVGTALFLKDFPSGFPEFVCCVGQMKPARFKETSGKPPPAPPPPLLPLLLLLWHVAGLAAAVAAMHFV